MNDENEKKAAMKKLRQERKDRITAAAGTVKAQGKDIQAIKARLAQEASTVPEISEATGIPSEQALWYIAALKKYGQVVERERDGSYYRYALAAKPDDSPDP